MAAPQRYSSKILLEYLPEISGDRQHRFRRGAETFGHLRYGLIFSGLKCEFLYFPTSLRDLRGWS